MQRWPAAMVVVPTKAVTSNERSLEGQVRHSKQDTSLYFNLGNDMFT